MREKEVKLIQQQLSAVQKFLLESLNASDQGELKVLEQEEIEEEKEAQERQERQKAEGNGSMNIII